jgi:hyperosmotically inducible protein
MRNFIRALAMLLSVMFLFTSTFALAQQKKSDDLIHDEVRRKLANDPDVKGGAFEVEVKDGNVSVSGTVDKEKNKEKAEKLIKKVKGVTGVQNNIVVKPKAS